MGDVIYVAATLAQLVAFAIGIRPTTLGLALVLYGAGLYLTARSW